LLSLGEADELDDALGESDPLGEADADADGDCASSGNKKLATVELPTLM